jgi:TolB-like protein
VPARRRAPLRGLAGGALVALVAAAGYVIHLVARPVAGRNMVDVTAERQATFLTLTVLPFEALGDGGQQAYLARGIGNDLMTELSRLPGLRLIAASRAAPHGAAKARYLVSGSVQREAGTLRINVRLIDSGSGQQLWSERYERPYGDLFKVQDELTRKLT